MQWTNVQNGTEVALDNTETQGATWRTYIRSKLWSISGVVKLGSLDRDKNRNNNFVCTLFLQVTYQNSRQDTAAAAAETELKLAMA